MKSKFKIEVKKQSRLAISAAVGFVIAFAWRDFILEFVDKIILDFNFLNVLTSRFVSAISVTFIGVLIIIISSKLLK